MSMSKKDFIALADTLRPHALYDPHGELVDISAWGGDSILDALCRFMAAQNPRFDRERWLGYLAGTCGPNGGSKVCLCHRCRKPAKCTLYPTWEYDSDGIPFCFSHAREAIDSGEFDSSQQRTAP